MSEQDKRPVFMGTFERHKKEMQVKHESLVSSITFLNKHVTRLYIAIATAAIMGICIAFAI